MLLHRPAEWALARLLPLAYYCALLLALRARRAHAARRAGLLHRAEAMYIAGLVPLDAFCSFVHPLLLAPRWPFLPLMATSTYCALGVLHATALTYRLWADASGAAPAGGGDGKAKGS